MGLTTQQIINLRRRGVLLERGRALHISLMRQAQAVKRAVALQAEPPARNSDTIT